jgi:hypothetical protein
MNKLVGLIGCSQGLDFSVGETLEVFDKKVGANTGNLVFQYAVGKLLGGHVFDIGINSTWAPHDVRSACDKIVFPCANFINSDSDFEQLANYLISLKLPVVPVGLGAQAKDTQSDVIPLKKGTEKLIRYMAESSETVGVRGEYTAHVLEKMGIHNVTVLGCPSNLISSGGELEQAFRRKLSDDVSAVTVNGHNPWSTDPTMGEIERFLFKFAYEHKSDYLAQSHTPLLRMASRRRYMENEAWGKEVDSLYSISGLDVGEKAFREFVERSFYYSMHVPSWMQRSSFYSLSIGLRLHGNMVAFQAGTPSLWISHDSRTSELIDFMKLPQLSFERLQKIKRLDEMKEIFSAQLEAYFERRGVIQERFDRFWNANGLVRSR